MTVAEWNLLVAEVNGKRELGMPGVRDPEAPCEAFSPVGVAFQQVKESELTGHGDCETDGHYMCTECTLISVGALRHRQSRCDACGTPLIFRGNDRVEPTFCQICEGTVNG